MLLNRALAGGSVKINGGVGMFKCDACQEAFSRVSVWAFLAFLFSFGLFFPGLMGNDSIYQYGQMTGAYPLSNIHPPVMVWIWRGLDLFYLGAAGPLLLQTGLYWIAMGMIASKLGQNRFQRMGLLLLGFFPPVYNMSLHIYKDGMLLVFWMMSVACSIYFLRYKKVHLVLGALAFCVLGILLRHNAWPAGVILIVLNVYWLCNYKFQQGRKFGLFMVCAVLGGALVLSGFIAQHRVVEKRNLPQLLAPLHLWDLYHMSLLMDKNIFPARACGEKYAQMSPAQVLNDLRQLQPVDTAVPLMDACIPQQPGIAQSFQVAGFADGWLMKYWLHMVIKYPGVYLQHRMRVMGWFFSSSSYLYHSDIAANEWGIRLAHPGMVKAFLFIDTFLFRPLYNGWLWVVILALMAWGSLTKVRAWGDDQVSRELVLGLSLSGLLYFLPLFFLIWSPDYRYMIWSIFAGILCLGIFFCTFRMECHKRT